MKGITRPEAAVALVALVICFSCLTLDVEPNSASRLATAFSLVEQGTWAIDGTKLGNYTIDKVFVDPHFYSSKPPLQSFLLAGVYWLLKHGFDLEMLRDLKTVVAASVLVFGILPLIAILYLLIGYVLKSFPAGHARLQAIGVVCFASMLNGYASALTNQVPAAALLFGALLLLSTPKELDTSKIVFSGALVGFACAFAIVGASLVFVVSAVWLLYRHGSKRLAVFGLAGAPPVLLSLAYYYWISGNPLPFYLQSDLYIYEGSPWHGPGHTARAEDSIWLYIFHNLFGHHGFFSMTPVFLFGLAAMFSAVRQDTKMSELAYLTLASTVLFIVFYGTLTQDYSGLNVGNRWFLLLAPFYLLFTVRWMCDSLHNERYQTLFFAAFGLSFFNHIDALLGPWRASVYEVLYVKAAQAIGLTPGGLVSVELAL